MYTDIPTGTERLVPTRLLRPGDIIRPHAGVTFVVGTITRYGTQQQSISGYALHDDGRFTRHFALGLRTTLVDLSDLPTCTTCQDGCYCQQGGVYCSHFGCWGRPKGAGAPTCPGAMAELVSLYVRIAHPTRTSA